MDCVLLALLLVLVTGVCPITSVASPRTKRMLNNMINFFITLHNIKVINNATKTFQGGRCLIN